MKNQINIGDFFAYPSNFRVGEESSWNFYLVLGPGKLAGQVSVQAIFGNHHYGNGYSCRGTLTDLFLLSQCKKVSR